VTLKPVISEFSAFPASAKWWQRFLRAGFQYHSLAVEQVDENVLDLDVLVLILPLG
jgi:hypothetical protein